MQHRLDDSLDHLGDLIRKRRHVVRVPRARTFVVVSAQTPHVDLKPTQRIRPPLPGLETR